MNQPQPQSDWVFPGYLVTIAPGIYLTVHYDQIDGIYHTSVKLFVGTNRFETQFDENGQIDLRHLCCMVIKRLAIQFEDSGRPRRTLISKQFQPYSWDKPQHKLLH